MKLTVQDLAALAADPGLGCLPEVLERLQAAADRKPEVDARAWDGAWREAHLLAGAAEGELASLRAVVQDAVRKLRKAAASKRRLSLEALAAFLEAAAGV